MGGGLYRVTFEGFVLGDGELAALSRAGFEVEHYTPGRRADDSDAIASGKYFGEVRGRADDPPSAAGAVEDALGGEASGFSNFRAERMITLGPRGTLRPDRRGR